MPVEDDQQREEAEELQHTDVSHAQRSTKAPTLDEQASVTEEMNAPNESTSIRDVSELLDGSNSGNEASFRSSHELNHARLENDMLARSVMSDHNSQHEDVAEGEQHNNMISPDHSHHTMLDDNLPNNELESLSPVLTNTTAIYPDSQTPLGDESATSEHDKEVDAGQDDPPVQEESPFSRTTKDHSSESAAALSTSIVQEPNIKEKSNTPAGLTDLAEEQEEESLSMVGSDFYDSPSGTKWLRDKARNHHSHLIREVLPRSGLGKHFSSTERDSLTTDQSSNSNDSPDATHDVTIEPDQLPDVSFEQSFMPPHTSSPSMQQSGSSRIEEPPRSGNLAHVVDASDELDPRRTAEVTSRTILRSIEQNSATRSPGTFSSPSTPNPKAWETPAATKQYMKELPTRTAIARRVESFQIPPERLAALQPEILAMQNQNKRQSDQLSLKESSAQIDNLLNENWGLKMKIMFMDKHFENDRDKAEVIAENVRLQTNGYNFVQQVKARDKTIRGLEKQIEQLELQNLKSEADRQGKPADDTLEKINELEHYINVLEDEHDKVVNELASSLSSVTARLKAAEVRSSSRSRSPGSSHDYDDAHDALLVEQLKESLMQAEQDIDELENELEKQADDYELKLAESQQQVTDYQRQLKDDSEHIRAYEMELAQSDKLREDIIEEIREAYENERLEYETYIEDRHVEIDNLKRAINSYNQDSFEQRLAEAIRPQEQAWKEINQQCEDLRIELSEKDAVHKEDTVFFERELMQHKDQIANLQVALADREVEILRLQDVLDRYSGELSIRKVTPSSESPVRRDAGGQVGDESRIRTLSETNQALSIEIENRQELLSQLQQDLEDRDQEIADLRKHKQDSEQHLSELDELCEAYQNDISSLHAELDDRKHEIEHLKEDVTHQRANSPMLQNAREELASSRLEIERLEAHISAQETELTNIQALFADISLSDAPTESLPLSSLIKNHLESSDMDRQKMQQTITQLTAVQENLAAELRKRRRSSEAMQALNTNLEKKLENSQQTSSDLQSKTAAQAADIHRLQKTLEKTKQGMTNSKHDLEKALGNNQHLLMDFLQKMQRLLAMPELLLKGEHSPNVQALSSASDRLLKELAQRLKISLNASDSSDAALKEQILKLEAQLSTKARGEEQTRDRLMQLKDEIDLLRKEKALPRRLIQSEPNAETTNPANEKAADALTKPIIDDYWTLHERIKALTKELKYQKELREQDDQAARSRLAESKREKKELMDTVRRLRIDDKTSQSPLSIESTETLVQ